MSKYFFKISVDAVLLLEENVECVEEINKMLPGVPHYFTDDGMFITQGNGSESDLIPYNCYIVKEEHGVSVMSKELFESKATATGHYHTSFKGNAEDVTVKTLRDYFNQLPDSVMGEEVWLGTDKGTSINQCISAFPLNKRDDVYDVILECVPYD